MTTVDPCKAEIDQIDSEIKAERATQTDSNARIRRLQNRKEEVKKEYQKLRVAAWKSKDPNIVQLREKLLVAITVSRKKIANKKKKKNKY